MNIFWKKYWINWNHELKVALIIRGKSREQEALFCFHQKFLHLAQTANIKSSNYDGRLYLSSQNHLKKIVKVSFCLIWFDLRVHYDLSSVQIHNALYEFFFKVIECSWTRLHYKIDYVSKNTNLNTSYRKEKQFDNIRPINASSYWPSLKNLIVCGQIYLWFYDLKPTLIKSQHFCPNKEDRLLQNLQCRTLPKDDITGSFRYSWLWNLRFWLFADQENVETPNNE